MYVYLIFKWGSIYVKSMISAYIDRELVSEWVRRKRRKKEGGGVEEEEEAGVAGRVEDNVIEQVAEGGQRHGHSVCKGG